MTSKDEVKKIKEAISEEEDGKEEGKRNKEGKENKEPKITDLPGIEYAVSAKLESAGIYDLMTIAVMTPSDLGDTAGISPAVARKAIQAKKKDVRLGVC